MKSDVLDMISSLEGGKGKTFVVIADIELKEGAEAEFAEWFAESNRKVLSKLDGFQGRKLLKSADGRQLRIILSCASRESFLKFYQSREHMTAHHAALTFMSRPPQLSFYEVMSE